MKVNNADWTADAAAAAENVLGYSFRNKELLKTAFTHPTYKNVHGGEDNDRLEFLGDAVLQICISEKIFQEYPDWNSGKMTDLRQQYVSQEALTEAEQRAGLMQFLRYEGRSDNLDGKTNSNLFEAVTAAIYLDGGKAAAEKFIFSYLQPVSKRNYRQELQEFVQAKIKKKPDYTFEREENGIFYFRVTALGKSANGSGANKQAAQKQAAERLLVMLQSEDKL